MRITFILPIVSMGGGTRVVAIYAEALSKMGHEVVCCSFSPKQQSLKNKIKSLVKGRGWPMMKNTKSHFDNIDVKHTVLDVSRPIIDEDLPDADVIIATWWKTAEWVNNLSEAKGRKYYFIQGHEVHSHLPTNRVKATYRLPFKKITIAQWLVDTMRDEYGDSDVRLVPNGIDTSVFYSSPRNKNVIPTFCLMYAIESFKGTDVSIAAFEYAKEKYPEIKLLVFGAKEVDEKIPLPEGASFYLSPTQEKIREIYSQSDAYIFSSRKEGFGLPVLEAMACRCPVIATKAGCAPDVIEHGINGELNNIDDIKAQGESIIKIIEMDNASWENMSVEAFTAVKDQSWDTAAIEFERILLNKK